ncbi:MAG TPA: SGNH/GDSL hydrolase family protein [Myxococcota bacterium]|nr:SGNH/GDSL hydrolase family protein [Myxococcota bacterium]
MRWVLFAASVAFSLVLAELVARQATPEVYLQRRVRDAGVLIPYEPNTEADLLTDEFRVRYRTNSFGYRDRLDRRAERTPGVARIALLGDSFAAGWGVEFEETFGDRFERATGIEVVNTAKNGGCPLWFVPQARYIRERFAPDWLLVQIFDNDLDDNVSYSSFRIDLGARFVDLPPDLRTDTPLWHRISQDFDSLVLRRRFHQLARRMRGDAPESTPYVKPGARPGFRILSRAESIAVHHVDLTDARVYQPAFSFHVPAQAGAFAERIRWNAQLIDQLLEESAAAGAPVALLYVPAYDIFVHPPAPNPLADSVREVARRRGALWIDLAEAFAARANPEELYHAYDGHLNAAGHAAVAELLEQRLAPRVTAGRAAR